MASRLRKLMEQVYFAVPGVSEFGGKLVGEEGRICCEGNILYLWAEFQYQNRDRWRQNDSTEGNISAFLSVPLSLIWRGSAMP